MFLKTIIVFILCFNFLFAKEIKFKVDEVLKGFDTIWALAFLDENTIIFNEKDGDIYLYKLDNKKLIKIKNPPKVLYSGQGGLLDVAVSKNYKKDAWIYFTYVKEIGFEGATTLSRAKLKNDRLIDFQELLVSKSTSSTKAHFGSRITFDKKGNLYFSIGDRGLRNSAQDLTSHSGSILRLKVNGGIPNDNPFIKNKNALNEIYSYGHRNPQGIFYDNLSDRLFAIEHGPRGGDEINIIKKGANYGWPIISHGKEYWAALSIGEGTHKRGMEDAIKVYIPSIAPSSLLVYSGKLFKSLKGNLFAGALKLRHLNRIVLNKDGQAIKEYRYLEGLGERIRDVVESKRGYIYISTDSGKILKLSAYEK